MTLSAQIVQSDAASQQAAIALVAGFTADAVSSPRRVDTESTRSGLSIGLNRRSVRSSLPWSGRVVLG